MLRDKKYLEGVSFGAGLMLEYNYLPCQASPMFFHGPRRISLSHSEERLDTDETKMVCNLWVPATLAVYNIFFCARQCELQSSLRTKTERTFLLLQSLGGILHSLCRMRNPRFWNGKDNVRKERFPP